MDINNLKHKNIVFISFGEYVTNKTLIYSQMLKLAEFLYEQKVFKTIKSIICLPITPILKRYKFHKQNIQEITNSFKHNIHILYTPLVFGRPYSFILKTYFYKLLKYKAYKILNSLEGEIILHCRSYYATDFALFLKKSFPEKNIKIIFDMRSLLPPEFPLSNKIMNKLLYPFAKEWERYLIKQSDLVLLTTNNGIRLLHLEDPSYNIKKINLIGFSENLRAIDINDEFEKRWNNKKLAYVGSVGAWHPLESIEMVINFFKENFKESCDYLIATNNIKLNSEIKIISISHKEMPIFYRTLLGIIVPGIIKSELTYFQSLKLTSNFFSTKAAESLSLGVPIIVNNKIKELSDFVIENNCGIVFDYDEQKNEIKLLNTDLKDINSKYFWYNLTKNAYEIGKYFTEENVRNMYINYWSEI